MLASVRCAVTHTSRRRIKSKCIADVSHKQINWSSSSTTEQSSFKNNDPNVNNTAIKNVKIDKTKVPVLNEADLEENFISGGGPGGQKVNKAVNCCQIKHNPTGIVVKVHQSRSLEQNRKIAREILIGRLDNLYNGENSVENQKKRIALERIANRDVTQERKRAMKAEFKKLLEDEKKSTSDKDVT